jgi:probable phosphoglycerate mutase
LFQVTTEGRPRVWGLTRAAVDQRGEWRSQSDAGIPVRRETLAGFTSARHIVTMPAQLYLLRHGETAWSLTGQHTGRTDLPLTAAGENEASLLRPRLAGVDFTHVFTSPLQRAWRTCELAGLGRLARMEPDLPEWHYGDYEGLTTDQIRARQPGWNVFDDGCPRGESVAQVSKRADRVLATVRPLDGAVALFSHGHFLRALAVRWIGLPLRDGRLFDLDTGSLSILGYEHADQDSPVISRWNTGAPAG